MPYEPKSERLEIRIQPSKKTAVLEAAEAAGKKLSDYVEGALDAALRRRRRESA